MSERKSTTGDYSFEDANKGASGFASEFKLSDASGDWDTLETDCGEVGLIPCLNKKAGKDGSVDDYTRHQDIQPNAVMLDSTPPTQFDQDTFSGWGFNADAEAVYFNFHIPTDWDGGSDMKLNVIWMAESGDAVADTETVEWNADYRSIAEGETSDNGTAVTATATHTQSGAGSAKELYKTQITIDYDDSNQPLAVGDNMGIKFYRDVTTDTYSGEAIVVRWELEYTANKIGTH